MDVAMIKSQSALYVGQMQSEIDKARSTARLTMVAGAAIAALVAGAKFMVPDMADPFVFGLGVGIGLAIAAAGYVQSQAATAMDGVKAKVQSVVALI